MRSYDQYGSAGEFHDWYLIGLALLTLYLIIQAFPVWGIRFGWLVLLLALLTADRGKTLDNAVNIIKTGYQGNI
jgi:hypothetical protein